MDSLVLDLFSGTGALGLEAYSRGARMVVLVDNGKTALRLSRKNAELLSVHRQGRAPVIISDDLRNPAFIEKLPSGAGPPFDIIFADPPYDRGLSSSILHFIARQGILCPDGVVVVEERSGVSLPEEVLSLGCYSRRNYGEACFFFYGLSAGNPA